MKRRDFGKAVVGLVFGGTVSGVVAKASPSPIVYDWEDGRLGRAEIFDANGVEYRRVLQCNTRTGYIHKIKLNKNGDIMLISDGSRVAKDVIRAPAPLRVVFQ